jgi:hypothetical protein
MAKRLPGIIVSDEIPLDAFDETGETWVKFRRPKRWEVEELSKVQAESELMWDLASQGRLVERRLTTMTQVESEMVYLCLVDSNLLDEEGEPVFVPGKSCRMVKGRPKPKVRDAFFQAWGDVDGEVASEIVEKLMAFHPPFNWRSPQQAGES